MNEYFSATADLFPGDSHRELVTRSICEAKNLCRPPVDFRTDNGTATVLGAGPCNDLDLRRLTECFSQINLVDLDASLLQTGLQAQKMENNTRLKLFGKYDLSGIQPDLDLYAQNPPGNQTDLSGLVRKAGISSWPELPAGVDVIASTCLLSQLIVNVMDGGIGNWHKEFVPLIQAIRKRHVALMLNQVRPGGIGLLIFDFVSSATLPRLPILSGKALEHVLREAIEGNNFFHGMNPLAIEQIFKRELSEHLDFYQFSRPWVWKTTDVHYAVTRVAFRRK